MTERKKKKSRIIRWIITSVVMVLCVSLAAGALVISGIAAGAPELNLDDATPDRYFSTVLDDRGQRILNLTGAEANRVYVTLDEIPDDLENAVIAIEDRRFYEHNGIDVTGMLRAALKNITSGSMEGASTITQQLIKNNVLTGWTQEQTAADKVTRKIREQKLALDLEEQTSKEWILENYLNTINLGRGAWGVEAAALRYFGKHVSQLTLSECASIAAIIKNPGSLDPLDHPEENEARRLTVLKYMLKQDMITQEQYDEAVSDDIAVKTRENNVPVGAEVFSYFEDALVYQIIDDLKKQLGLSGEEAWELLYTGGLTILSTQDTYLQTLCEETVNRDSLYLGDEQSAVVMIDQKTGQVKALVGGRGEKNASLLLNRATEVARQPGSTIKIVGEYSAALDTGAVTLATVYDDAPYRMK